MLAEVNFHKWVIAVVKLILITAVINIIRCFAVKHISMGTAYCKNALEMNNCSEWLRILSGRCEISEGREMVVHLQGLQ